MFDWNDDEITNIIWGETGENDDHIVPYPDGSEEKPSGVHKDQARNEWNERAEDVNPNERKPVSRTDSMGIGASKNVTEISKHGETAQLNNCSEIFTQEGEQGDIVDYDWANVGSFDDLDRIFSNDDPIFGHASLSNADNLWSSSKDVTGSLEKTIPIPYNSPSTEMGALKSTFDPFLKKSENILHQNHPSASFNGNMNNITSNTPHNLQACTDTTEYTGGKSKALQREKRALEVSGNVPAFNSQLSAATLAVPDEFTYKGNRRKRLLKTRVKSEEKSKVRELQEICSTWSTQAHQFQQFDSQYAPTIGQPCSPFLMNQQRQFFPGPFLASPMFATMATQYPPMAVLSQFHSGESNPQKLNPGYEVSPSNSDHASVKPLSMSPQEKIEKLRRRQQMRAMMAIQKQQQQFNDRVSSTKPPPITEGANTVVEENLNIVPALDPNTQVEHGDSNKVCIPSDDLSMEDSILYQLQDIIGKLDNRIRLCIRDSLFRLAQSTSQRKYASDTSGMNSGTSDEVLNKEESNSLNRFGRRPDVETQTNPIDRTVAHLLFHRPLVPTGKHTERPESPSSEKHHPERSEVGSISLSTFLPQSSDTNQMLSRDESKVSLLFPEGGQSKSILCVDTSVNASNKEAADGAVLRFEASNR